ncbi:MAG: ATP-dependent 6-phosphofructokinase [Caldisericia bacterium]|nr:ATP-dependent 6-phosphofructokinase [Caldisericia bacterium]
MRIAVLTSGGDAPGMNAAVRAVTRTAIYKGMEVMGVKKGFAGLMTGEFKKMCSRDVGSILSLGGTILLTARAPEFSSEEGINRALASLKKYQIDALVVIGGNGSQRGSNDLHKKGFPVVGIASTIDNDVYGTHSTIGFDTALNNAVGAIDKIRDTATSHQRVFVVEVMGRDRGILALHCGIAVGADCIVIPERSFNINQISEKIKGNFELGKKHFIVVLAEGAAKAEKFADALQLVSGIHASISVLGYLQRGGNPTFQDRFLATNFGVNSVQLIEQKKFGYIVGVQNNHVVHIPMEDVATNIKPIDENLFELQKYLCI